MDKRALFYRRDVWLLTGFLLLTLLSFLLFRLSGQPANTAQIMLDGQIVRIVSLEKDGEFALEQNPHIRFSVRDGAIAFISSDCPDQLCVHSGYLSQPGQMTACLPRHVSLSVSGAGGVDAVAN